MTAVGAALRWAHLLFTFLLVGIFGLTLLAGRAAHSTPRSWQARMLTWSRRAALAALGSGVLLLALQAAHVAGRAGAAAPATGTPEAPGLRVTSSCRASSSRSALR